MGNRVKGRRKPKSIKAAVASDIGSKRKLSRMGKKRKRHKAGLDATFIGRSACLRKLQVTLKDFRRLCILKGVYPREPRGRAPKNKKGQVYYHIRDVRAIAREPILNKFREFRAFMRKVRRAAGRLDREEARRLDANAPQYSLHHLVRERYPRFIDALSDLDDALALVYLFAALPSERKIRTKVTSKAKSLSAAWGAYCAITSSITKTFISVKGVYLEADVQGTTVRWIVPHAFTQNLPKDVDYRVMLTFFEFYETLLSFVLFKLYSDIGVRYPVVAMGEQSSSLKSLVADHIAILTRRDGRASEEGASAVISKAVLKKTDVENEEMSSVGSGKKDAKGNETIKAVGAALYKLADESDDEDNTNSGGSDDGDEDGVDVSGPLKAALESMSREEEALLTPGRIYQPKFQLGEDAIKRKRLFCGLTFFFSREVPRGYLDLVCMSFGGRVGWEGEDSPVTVRDKSITHHVVDRPNMPSSYDTLPKSREYIQPQWIVDCANFHFLLPCSRYGAGLSLPPHLSPWVDDEDEGYQPAYAKEVERMINGELPELEAASVDSQEGRAKTNNADGDLVERAVDEDATAKRLEPPREKGGMQVIEDEQVSGRENDDMETEDDESSVGEGAKDKKEDEEAKELAKLMMSKKAKRLYGRMQHGISQKQAKVDALKRRRKELEQTKEKSKEGKTLQKQKVERLREERRELEKEYCKAGKGSSSAKKRKKKKSPAQEKSAI